MPDVRSHGANIHHEARSPEGLYELQVAGVKRTIMHVEIDDPRLRFLVLLPQVSVVEHPIRHKPWTVA